MSELEILESIFPDFISTDQSNESNLKLEIPVQLGEPARTVRILPEENGSDYDVLTPILIEPPSVSIRSSWLPPPLVFQLHGLLRDMWRAGDGTWLSPLALSSSDIRTPPRIASLFSSYDDSARSELFSRASYSCAVCLTSVKGTKCLQLACSHVFCRSCLYDYWAFSIAEGSVEKLGCPDPECVKVGRESAEEEIARVVSEQEVRRWRWLKEKIMFEKDPSLVHCPMVFCQNPVPKPKESQTDEGGDRLRICPACSFSFCGFCKRTWHGAVQDCPISQAESVVLEYLAFEENSKERQLMELRFGKIILRKLVAKYQEEQLNKKWLAESTMACPGCALSIEKSLGCNHMTCSRCRMHFCYRCGVKLLPSDPYAHFSDKYGGCYQKLFDFTSEELEWQPMN
ncbi:KH domain protein [Mycena venus]|uniref:RBR-type E3 ubiquitin transferase n=1 Tax=Mycena venus TaxID=2733690 RepID=A0A8H7CL10_9AGAR|nr:KH domain protein [Mycena venus]